MVHQHLTVWQIYFLAFENGSQTHLSAEVISDHRASEGTPEVTQSPFPLSEADLTLACLDKQASFFSKTFLGKQSPYLPHTLSRPWKPFSPWSMSLKTNCLSCLRTVLLKRKAGWLSGPKKAAGPLTQAPGWSRGASAVADSH